MEDNKSKRRLHDIYPNARKMNLNYWERLQKVLDATGTRGQNMQVRKKWIERQHLTNYRNEFDRLMGEMTHLRPELRAEATRVLMDEDKLNVLGNYVPETRVEPEPPAPAPRRKRGPNLTAEQREQTKLEIARSRIERFKNKKRNLQ